MEQQTKIKYPLRTLHRRYLHDGLGEFRLNGVLMNIMCAYNVIRIFKRLI